MRIRFFYILLLTCFLAKAQAPTLGSYTSNVTGIPAALISLTKPIGGVVGDVYIIIVGNDDINSTAEFDIWGAWKKIGEAGTSVADTHVAVFYKKVTGTEGISETVNANSTNYIWGYYIVVKDVDTDPLSTVDVVGTLNDNISASSHTITGITTTQDNTLAFSVIGFDGGDGTSFGLSGTGWSKIAEKTSATGATGVSGSWATKTMTTAGTTLNTVWTPSVTDGAAGFQFAIKGIVNNRRIFNINK